MDVKFIVFVEKPVKDESAHQVKIFTEMGYAPNVDGLHKKDYLWFRKNIVVGKLFIQDLDKVYMFDVHELDSSMTWTPDFAILFNDDEKVDDETWKMLHQFVEESLLENEIDMTNAVKVETLLKKPFVEKAILEDIPMVKPEQDHYSFDTKLLEDDIRLYEVRKPFTDLPYTSVTRNFSKKGHKPFFTDLFICPSWGVARADVLFLQYLWTEMKMEGEFNLDILMKEAVEKCTPSETNIPEPEPEVYRRNLYDVEKILEEKKSKQIKFIPNFLKNKD